MAFCENKAVSSFLLIFLAPQGLQVGNSLSWWLLLLCMQWMSQQRAHTDGQQDWYSSDEQLMMSSVWTPGKAFAVARSRKCKKCDWGLISGDFLVIVVGLKKYMDMILDLPMVKKTKESWASSSCSTEEEMKAKCCSLSFLSLSPVLFPCSFQSTCWWVGTPLFWVETPGIIERCQKLQWAGRRATTLQGAMKYMQKSGGGRKISA